MAPKKASSGMRVLLDFDESIRIALPCLYTVANDADDLFTGMVFFIGDYSDLVVGCRRLTSEGERQVIWASGPDFVGCLMALEQRLSGGWWKEDTKYVERAPVSKKKGKK